ncbi:MAG: GAF domain-containing sensor histidine kinase [Dehalococcoidia bacterium]|nr:GAF domain-containing sensor histidine kinase [Dehalococcoidia bacterium]
MAGLVQEQAPIAVLVATTAALARTPGRPGAWNKPLQALAQADSFFAGTTTSICRFDVGEGIREILGSVGPQAHELTRESLPLRGLKDSSSRLFLHPRDGKPFLTHNGHKTRSIVAGLLERISPSSPAESLIVVPLLSNVGNLIGAIWVEGCDSEAYSRERMQLLQVLGNCMSLALAASIHHGEAEEGDAVLKAALEDQEKERERIALDVHDGALQMLASAFQHVQAVRDSRRQDEETARNGLVKASGLLRETMHELRGLMDSLRPASLDRFGLIASIEAEVQELCQDGWDAELVADVSRLTKDRETSLYRIVHEALTNVRNHAGFCPVRVSLKRGRFGLLVEVRDWGCGFDPAALTRQGKSHGFGLLSMRKRAELLGGKFEVESRPGEGARISFHIPLRRKGD